jgi:hypothetical protein
MPLSPRLLSLICLACLLLIASGPSPAQEAVVATISFTCDFPGSNPSHYGLVVTAARQASYTSNAKVSMTKESSTDDAVSVDDSPFQMDFILSAATTARIFALAKAAHYFEGDLDSKKKNIAFTGDKSLTYRGPNNGNSYITHYNYSPVPAVQEITALFQNLSSAVEFGRRLDYEYRYQKLALDEVMKGMEQTTTLQEVGTDLPAAAPVLQKIADDPSVINPVRARAMRLLQRAETAK